MVDAVSAGIHIEGGGWGAEVKASATYKTQTSEAQTSTGVRYIKNTRFRIQFLLSAAY